ncbi:uncharacterized protein BJX67DRAFT_280910 [Aspergillus lucknowensis]|uniref:Uncharacterized protein n=1 Tax=Aspergillus lucknowensis TaxID=176173 RepID=A0ABR4M0K9_9EURO
MKISLAAVAAFVSAVTAATLPPAFTLVADGGYTVLTDGEYLYINGNATTNEIALFHSSPSTGAVTFTSRNSTPTGWQNLYVVEKDVLPVGLTRPHSGAVPEGASINDFGTNEAGYFTHAGKDYFAVDGYSSNPQKTIYWYGRHNSVYRGVNLWVKEFRE